MILIAGLGNPGKKYQDTRHNIGFRTVDEIAACFQPPIFKFQPIFKAQTYKTKTKDQNIILVKPQTFMNFSGKAISKIALFYKIKSQNIIIIHDDIDLFLGKIRIVKNRGAGGHKGVESVVNELKTKNFTRFRIGIKPGKKPENQKKIEKFVLQKFNKEEEKAVEKVIKKTKKAVELFLEEGLEKAMNKFNK